MPNIDLSILNQRQTPAFFADTLANRPAAGFVGRVFISTDTFDLYRDTGASWVLLSPANAGTITGGGSLYRVGIWTSTSNLGESNNLVFDYSTNRLGINTNTPGASLDVHSTQSTILQLNQTSINDTRIAFQLSGSALWRLGNFYNGGANDFELFDVVGAQASMTIKKTTGQVLIGTSSVGAGKLVVSSTASDNGVQIVGANAPSLRLDNLVTGATIRAGLGISTAVNNFIQGSANRDFCIFNGSTTASPMLFGIYDAGLTNVQEAARISAARNFIVNSVTDSGERLQVNGTTILKSGLGNVNVNAFVITGTGGNLLTLRGIGDLTLSGPDPTYKTGASSYGGGQAIISSNQATGNSFFHVIHNNSNTAIQALSNSVVRLNPQAGNVLIGTTTDAGFRLDVNGTARFGSVFNTAATFINLGNTSYGSTNDGINYNTSGIGFLFAATAAATSNPIFTLFTGTNTATSGTTNWLNFRNGSTYTFAPTSGTGVFNAINLAPIIFQTGGANGITRGLFINSTLTAAADYRAIETTIGNVCLGTTSGNVLIGTATSGASKLRIVGLPTSAAGLSSGDVWNNAGVLNIVP